MKRDNSKPSRSLDRESSCGANDYIAIDGDCGKNEKERGRRVRKIWTLLTKSEGEGREG